MAIKSILVYNKQDNISYTVYNCPNTEKYRGRMIMWACVIIIRPLSSVICKLFTFQSSSLILMGQIKPNVHYK